MKSTKSILKIKNLEMSPKHEKRKEKESLEIFLKKENK